MTDADGGPLAPVVGARAPAGAAAIYVATHGPGFKYERRDGARVTPLTHNDVVAELQAKASRGSLLLPYVLGALACSAALSFVRPVLGGVCALLAAAGGYLFARWDRGRRTARIAYDLDDRELLLRACLCATLGETLARSAGVWLVLDRKRDAGSARASEVPGVETNLTPWGVFAGDQQVFFLPDCLLVRRGRQLSAHPYAPVSASSRQLNDYGELTLTWPAGFSAGVDTKDPQAAGRAQRFVQRLQQLASGVPPQAPSPQVAPQAAPQSAQPPSQAPVEPLPMGASLEMASQHDGGALRASMLDLVPAGKQSSRSERMALLTNAMTLLKYIAAADRKIDPEEVGVIARALREFAADANEAELTMRSFKSTKADDADALVATHALRGYSPDYARKVVETAERVALADGQVTAKERERIDTLKVWLSG